MIKIFHTGDNHLDSAFARLSMSARERERARQRELFEKMMNYVKDEGFDLVLISGDLFDSQEVSPETEKAVIDAFSALSCPVVISPGNHDPYSKTAIYSSGRLPENVYVFNSPELQIFEFEELSASVCGYAFMGDEYSESPLSSAFLDKLCSTKLLCAHGELGATSSKYAPISESELLRAGFSYAALGHLHKIAEPVRIGKCLAAYCGFPEGRAFDELGLGGAMSVTVDGELAVAERIVFGERRYEWESLDVSSAQNDKELIERIRSFVNERDYGSDTALRLELCGSLAYTYKPDIPLIERDMSERLIKLEVLNKTVPELDLAVLEGDYTLRGEVYRVLRPVIEGEDAEKRRLALEALSLALLAIEGRRVF